MARDQEGEAAEPRHPIGQDSRPDAEIVRFRALPSLSFPTGSIRELRARRREVGKGGRGTGDGGRGTRDGGRGRGEIRTPNTRLPPSTSRPPPPAPRPPPPISPPPEMEVACMGLFGPGGPLPDHYTAMVIQRTRERDYSLRDFLDLFNHRTTSLFYRAWEKYRFTIAYERPQRTAGRAAALSRTGFQPVQDGLESGPTRVAEEDLFTQCLYCLIGWGTGGLRGRLAVDDEAILFYAGHFAHFPRSAVALELIVADYFELLRRGEAIPGPVALSQPRGPRAIAEGDGGRGTEGGGRGRAAKRLGDNLVVGQRVWDVQSKFRVRLGPVGYRQFRRFMPSGDALGPLCQITRSYAGAAWDFDVQPVLKAAEVPWCQLGGPPTDPARLGWNTWIRGREMEHDVDDAVFYLEG